MNKACSLVFVKLGGSLITDKNAEFSARRDVIARLAAEVRSALDAHTALSLLLGHGSGSFGHVVAKQYHVQSGCEDWRGYALTGAAAMELNHIVSTEFREAGVPVVSIQPSASARCRGGQLIELAVHPVQELLRRRLVPLVYGDVALDEVWGSTIASTEAIFAFLARALRPQRILLLGQVDGVYTADPRQDPTAELIPLIHAHGEVETEAMLGGSHGTDVTGGMRSKVQLMMEVVRDVPGLEVRLFSGLRPGLLEQVLGDPGLDAGTRVLS
jgi:isopentenyl phosphate kinase